LACPLPKMHASIQENLDNFVDNTCREIRRSVQDSFEQSLLIQTLDSWNNDDQPVVELQLRVLPEEMSPIVGDENVIVLKNERHQIVILPPTFSKPTYVVCRYSSLLGKGDQTDTQAFVD
jgi:hypothetical protein